jgi:hypothetical protein
MSTSIEREREAALAGAVLRIWGAARDLVTTRVRAGQLAQAGAPSAEVDQALEATNTAFNSLLTAVRTFDDIEARTAVPASAPLTC